MKLQMTSFANPIQKIRELFCWQLPAKRNRQHLAFGVVFKPVGWAKLSLTQSGSTSQGGKTGEKERSLRQQILDSGIRELIFPDTGVLIPCSIASKN
jgi:hypothetical protein